MAADGEVRGTMEESLSWNEQSIRYIDLNDLILWSENPRDPLDAQSDNEDIIFRALEDGEGERKWELDKFAKSMGEEFDFSELPTVVERQDGKYCVYDGNRRVILAMLSARGISPARLQMSLPMFPEAIPCNVCPREKALQHVYRKHSESGSWGAYERDLFEYQYLNGKKTILIRIEELVGGITRYPQLNQRYVRDDVLNDKHLAEIGLKIEDEDYGVSEATLLELVKAVASETTRGGALATRGKRNNPVEALPEDLLTKIRDEVEGQRGGAQAGGSDEDSMSGLFGADDALGKDGDESKGKGDEPAWRRKRKTRSKQPFVYPIFGGTLVLSYGDVNNIYSTLDSLWALNEARRIPVNASFVSIFRMGLRLLAESAAEDLGMTLSEYLTGHFAEAKRSLTEKFKEQDVKGYLFSNSIEQSKIVSLFQMGAHGKTSSANKEQAIALSLVLGSMLLISHGKQS